MKRRTQATLVLLAALLTASSLMSCGSPASTSSSDPESSEVLAEAELTETEPETSVIDLLPNADYEGYTFNILSTNPGTLWGWRVSIFAEEETGEPLNDAVFRRNTAIEERYNITIANSAELDNSSTSANAKQLAVAGDDLYSIGYDDYIEADGYCIAEWSENIENEIPEGAIFVTISNMDGSEGERRIEINEDIGV